VIQLENSQSSRQDGNAHERRTLTRLPIDTAIAIAKHKTDAAFALELEHDRERMLMDGV
jgi:hypothetical protein